MKDLLYHYTSSDALLSIIKNRTIWASCIHYLNDSKEFIHAIDETRAIIWHKKQSHENEGAFPLFEEIESRLEGISRVNIFVASLTERGDQLSQWRGYCSSGPGYSIGFSKKDISALAITQGFTFQPCIYDWQQQRSLLNETLARAENLARNVRRSKELLKQIVDRFLSDFVRIAPLLKHRAFSEEQEWRLVSGVVACTDSRWRSRAGRFGIVPYIEFSLDIDDTIPIHNIVVGPGPNIELSTNAISNLLVSSGIKKWSVTPSQIPYRTT